jgi:hypothetical protein
MWVKTQRGDCWLCVYGLRIATYEGEHGETIWALRAVTVNGAETTVAWNISEADARQLLAWFGEALLHDHPTFSIPFHLDLLCNGREVLEDA